MGIGSKLTKLLEANNTNANELATKIDVSPQTIYSIIKRDSKKADIEVLLKIADTFGVTAEYFVYDEKPIKADSTNKLLPSPNEEVYLQKIRFISNHSSAGTKMVSSVIDREYEIAQQLQKQANRIKELENNPIVVEKEKDSMSQKGNTSSRPHPSPASTTHGGDAGGAPGPKYTIPAPKPSKK